MRSLTLICSGLLALAPTAGAQETDADAMETPERYQVEVILFAYREATPEGEDLSAWQRAPLETDSLEAAPAPDLAVDSAPQRPAIRVEFETVPRDALALVAEAERLAGISAYRVLAHGAWQQLGVGPEDAQPFPVSRLRVSGGISGSLTLHVRRFPHLELELELPQTSGSGLTGRVLLKEQRRLRRGELHYFDHPAFGALVQVSRVEVPEPSTVG